MDINKEIIKILITENAQTKEDLERAKKSVAKKYQTSFPTNVSLLKVYHKMKGKDKRVLSLLKTRPVRSLSGVVNISVLTKPFPCPGKCIYCPNEKDVPKSYLSNEPAVMRAIINNYHPAKQTAMRIKSLQQTGHPTDKIELRVVGGTWSFYPERYKTWFIKSCFDACNEEKSKTLKEAQEKNEKAKHRIVCLSVETRPDFITKKEVKKLRVLGVTMVELGVQSLSDDVLKYTKRGHSKKATEEATKMLKDAGFKICYQVMLNLPKSTPKEDIKTFQTLFDNSSYRPDFLKMYPCLILKNTKLYSLWKKGEHRVFTNEELINVIVEIKKNIIPYYVRIQRLFRDIPTQSIAGGCKISNLREDVFEKLKEEKILCKCIRCREVKGDYNSEEEVFLFREDYDASEGKEVFLSIENKERSRLFAMLRLRETKNATISVLKKSTIIREIHTYGQHLEIKDKKETSPQHRGLGKRLIKEAERITKEEFGKNKITVISGVGVRGYWRDLGYNLQETYMKKNL